MQGSDACCEACIKRVGIPTFTCVCMGKVGYRDGSGGAIIETSRDSKLLALWGFVPYCSCMGLGIMKLGKGQRVQSPKGK